MSFAKPFKAIGSSLKHRRWESFIILVLISVASFSWSRRLNGPIDLRYDSSTYFVLGTSLADGKGYRLLNEPGEIEATQYPPFLPLIVAAHEWGLGTRDIIVVGHWLRITWFLSYVAFTLSVYFMLRQRLPLHYAFFGTLVCLLSLYTYLMSNQLAPEVLFGLCSCLFFLSSNCANKRRRFAFSFLFATASYALRTIGVTLFVAWVGEAVFQKRFRRAFVRLTLSLLPIVAWQSHIHRVESSRDYKVPAYEYQRADYLFYNVSYAKNIFVLKDSFTPELGHAILKDIASRFVENLERTPTSIGEAITAEKKCWLIPFSHRFPKAAELGRNGLLSTLGCIILCGVCLQLIRHQWLMPFYVLLSVFAICLTPWPIQLVRYFTPLCPFFAFSFFVTLQYLLQLSAQTRFVKVRTTVLSTVLLIGTLILIHQLWVYYRFSRYVDRVVYDVPGERQARLNVFGYFPAERATNGGLDWLMKESIRGVLATSTPQWAFLRTGLKAVMPPFEVNPDKAQDLLDSVPVTYVVSEEGFTRKYVSGVLQKHSDLWQEVYSNYNGRFKIYHRVDARENSALSIAY